MAATLGARYRRDRLVHRAAPGKAIFPRTASSSCWRWLWPESSSCRLMASRSLSPASSRPTSIRRGVPACLRRLPVPAGSIGTGLDGPRDCRCGRTRSLEDDAHRGEDLAQPPAARRALGERRVGERPGRPPTARHMPCRRTDRWAPILLLALSLRDCQWWDNKRLLSIPPPESVLRTSPGSPGARRADRSAPGRATADRAAFERRAFISCQ